ncbi:MAG: ChpI protein [Chloroflexota bacterium]
MKSDISIPNPVFHAAQNLAKKMGVSLSELYTAALNAYVAEHEKENITETLDQVYTDESSTLEPELVKMQAVTLNDSVFDFLDSPVEDVYTLKDGKSFQE